MFPCWVYRSGNKEEMYLYLAAEGDFAPVPAPLLRLFGRPTLVMRLDLHPGRPLAREEVGQVMHNLRTQGFHLQLPPAAVPEIPDA
jgi:uncharacterized protein YcgL (UPF0745 family)